MSRRTDRRMRPQVCSWPSSSDIEELRGGTRLSEMTLFFEVQTIVDFRQTLLDGTVISSQTLPSVCIRTVVP